MPRSSRHKSHKHSKHSSRDYSESDEEVIKSEKRSKDESSTKVHRDSASGEKRKGSSQVREGKDRDLVGHGNGEALEDYALSKRRKEKVDVIGDDRWCGDGDNDGEKEMHKGRSSRGDNKLKEYSNKGDDMEIDWNNKSKRHESGISGERKEDSIAAGKEEGKVKGESKRRSERDSSTRKEVRELKEKDHRSDKEKNGGYEGKGGDSELKLMDGEVGKKQAAQVGDSSKERQSKRFRENADQTDELRNADSEKEVEKKTRKKRDGSSERDKHHTDSKEGDERRLSSRGDRGKDAKYRDTKHKDSSYADKYQEDGHKDERRRDEKHRDEADKESKYLDDKYREDGDKDGRRRGDRHRQDGERERRKDEKHREDRERDSMRKDDKYWEGTEREARRDEKYYEDVDRDKKHKDGRYADKDVKRGDENYLEDENTDDRHRDTHRDDGNRNNRHREDKYRKDTERHKISKEGDGNDKDKRLKDSKYWEEPTSRDRSSHRSDSKRSRDDDYAADHYSRKSGAYDDSPTHDDRSARYRDDQRRRRADEKEDFSDTRSQPTKDRRSDAEKKSTGSERMDPTNDRVRPTSRTADTELTASHSRRRNSPLTTHATRDDYRAGKHDESKYRDYNYDERSRHSTSSRDYAGASGGSDKTSSRPLEKLGQKDGNLPEMSAERHVKSDIHTSPLEHQDKSLPSSTDRRQFNRSDVRRGVDTEESTPRSGGSRDWKEYSVKEGRGGRESAMDVPPGEEFLQADADTLSVSSPYMRNSHVSNSSKTLPATLLRTGVDSPSPLGSGEDEGRGKSNIRHRRISDSNMGRIQGNSWRGTPSWPSPVANGFLPFPPPVGFHSVIHPFPAAPMFGVRPSMDLDHPSPYHVPDADRYSGPGYPMGWRPQIDNAGRPLHAWDASNSVFAEGSNFYGRSDWDHAGNMPRGQDWETNEDLLRGPNRTASTEMTFSNKDNSSMQGGEESLAGQSLHPAQNEQSGSDQQAESTDASHLTKNLIKREAEDPLISLEDSSTVDKISTKNKISLCHVYFSKLDISADLAEPELFNEFMGLLDVDQSIFSDVDSSKILYMEDEEAKMASLKVLNHSLFASTDDSVFQKSLSLYQKQKVNVKAQGGEKLNSLNNSMPNSDLEDQKVDDVKIKEHPEDKIQVEDTLQNIDTCVDTKNCLEEEDIATKSEEPVSASDANTLNLELDLQQPNHDVDEEPLPAVVIEGPEPETPTLSNPENGAMEPVCKSEELKSLDESKCCSDMPTEASEDTMQELVVSGSVNLSRIHHSPENTH
ncbi:uncharacterized protein LOC127255529 [Andrographis paniculata]|uniref:uncharacterized protein LOC127255529 n=1 Tax=Andrographis paniculata TaxID=175694 RepID=UPI0021E87AC6|nr:uncharacterized protein LOC127255529 [Andrographis paniculata]